MSKNPVLNTYNFVSTSNRQLQLDSNQYELIIRQQPKQARLCSSKERDRRPVDPPPIIQLKVNGYGDEAQNFLQSPYYFMCANLVHPTDSGESFTVSSRYLAGTVVSSLHKLKDVDNKDGGFFVFGDISVRVEGRYRLRFSLFEIIRDEVVHILSEISDVFTVYSPKAFPGMSESTFLSRSFSDQGVRIRIRKEHRIQMKRPQSNNNNNRQSDNAEGDDDDDGITDVPVKRKRSKSQLVPVSTFKSTPPLELFDTTSVSYPSQSQHSPYTSSSNSPYQQFHKFPSGQRHSSDRSLSYPPPLGGYPQHSPPQRQHSYYEDSEYEQSSQSSRNNDHTLSYYGYEYNEQSMLNKRPRLSNSEVTCYDYRQPLPLNYNTTNHHHYNSNMNVSHHHNHHNHHNPPPPPPPPPHSSSSYRTPRRLSPLPENQPFYATSSTNTSSPHMFNHNNSSLPTRHHSFDTASSSNVTSLDSPFHYSVTATSSSSTTIPQQPAHSQPIPPSDTFYRPSSSTQSFHPKPPVRSHTLPPYINRNHNDNDNDNLHHHHNSHHQDSTASLTSSNQLPTPKHSIDVDGLHNQNKKQLYSSYPPLTPPNPNSSSSVDSYKSGNNSNNSNSSSSSSSNNNLAPSFTQHFTSSPRTAPIPLPSKSPLLSNNNSISKTNSLPVMPSNSNINSSNTTTTFLSDGDVLTSSPQLLPTNNLPRLPPITSLTGSLDFIMNKKKDNYYNDSIQQQQQQQSQEVTTQQYYHSHSIDDNLTYNNNNTWHNHGGGVNNGSNYGY